VDKEKDARAFAELVEEIHAAFGRSVNPKGIGLWWAALKDYELHNIRNGVIAHIATPDVGQRMPMPADITQAIRTHRFYGPESSDK
jgi:hypothetical protein